MTDETRAAARADAAATEGLATRDLADARELLA